MHPYSSLCTKFAVVLVGFLFAPMASAVPISGTLNGLPSSQLADRLAASENNRLRELLKEAGVRIRIGYGRYGYRRYYPRYGGYGRYGYYPSYSYGYRSKRHYYRPYKYRKHRYSKRYKKRRALRRLRRLLRHRYYY